MRLLHLKVIGYGGNNFATRRRFWLALAIYTVPIRYTAQEGRQGKIRKLGMSEQLIFVSRFVLSNRLFFSILFFIEGVSVSIWLIDVVLNSLQRIFVIFSNKKKIICTDFLSYEFSLSNWNIPASTFVMDCQFYL